MVEKNKDQNVVYTRSLKTRKSLFITAMVIVIAAVSVFMISNIQTNAQITSVGQTLNSIKEINPTAIVLKEKPSEIEGAPLTAIGKTITSHFDHGEASDVNESLAEMNLSHGTSSDGQDIIVATITNTGQEKFYVKKFGMGGETDQRISALGTLAIDSDYNPDVSRYKPASTEIVMLNPGESVSAYIKGKWTVSEINQPITGFGGTVLFYFDNDSKFYNGGYNWVIAVTN